MGRNRKDGTNKAQEKNPNDGFKPFNPNSVKPDSDISKIIDNELPIDAVNIQPEIPVNTDLIIPEKKQTKQEKIKAELEAKLNAIPDSDYQSFKDFLQVLFSTIASVKGEHWNLTELQAEGLSRPMARIFIKYLGTFDYKDEMMLAICLGGIIIPRMQKDKALTDKTNIKDANEPAK